MGRIRLLVVSPGQDRAAELARRLTATPVDVSAAHPGPDLIRAVRERRPHVVVMDGIDARPCTAALEVALVKDSSPDAYVIAVSAESSEIDGDVIEQGVFCYLAGCSLDELVRVIEKVVHERRAAEDPIEVETQPWSIS